LNKKKEKNMNTLEKIIQITNVKPASGGFHLAHCPWHEDEKPSLYLNQNGCQCMSCGKKTTLAELEEKLAAQVYGN
jgi:hypothetical protein